MKQKIILFFFIFSFLTTFSQNISVKEKDSLKPKELKEIIIISKKGQISDKQGKPLATIDEYLQKSAKVDMIKRGAYAWEPIINNMTTERTVITIDGMRIFGACTDKMDPVTSYVEVSNLSEATVTSGQEHACFGSTIGGSIDLKRNQNKFGERNWDFSINTGYETNNKQKIIGTALNYSDSLFYVDTDFMFRDADNYVAGNNHEVLFSQFRKINLSATSGIKFNSNKVIEASIIYDKATNVGYPSLPMDISLAEALITSLKFDYKPVNSYINDWETKIYFNTITHRMDDTKRPFVPIHMDMPGWSKTFGIYSKITGVYKKNHFFVNLNSFYNTSLATMTMYPNDPNEKPMFMITWPDILTFYKGIFFEDNLVLNCHSSIKFSASFANHSNKLRDEFGLNSLKIFYPDMKAQNDRYLKGFSGNYYHNLKGLEYGLGIGYGERAPSVTEGYGYYLFNSFENYDNIGNPNLKNENSIEGNVFIAFTNEKFNAKIATSYFHISNYIVAKPDLALIPMTIGAKGVKTYTTLDFATIFTINLTTKYKFSKQFTWNTQLGYSQGNDFNKENLPFISPFSYYSNLNFTKNKFSTELAIKGNLVQSRFSPIYGEDKTADFAILNVIFGYKFNLYTNNLSAKVGVENIMDTYYSTYSDWNNFPRQGRNLYINLEFRM